MIERLEVQDRIERDIKIAAGHAMIVLGTPTYIRSSGLTLDLKRAKAHGHPILVILWPGAEPRPDQIPYGTRVHRFKANPTADQVADVARRWVEQLPAP